MPRHSGISAAEEILLAAADLSSEGQEEFSEWDLTVAVWKRNKNKFGCRGYEQMYPDHKRVMMEIMAKSKKSNPIRRGWIEQTRRNHYRITRLGLIEAERIASRLRGVETSIAAADIYDAVERYAFHSAFEAYLRDPEEPRTWLGAAAFLGLTKYDPIVLQDKLSTAAGAINNALGWLNSSGTEVLRRGPAGGQKGISREHLAKLQAFLNVIQQRFADQIMAIRQRNQKRQ